MLNSDDSVEPGNWRKSTRSKAYGECVEVSGGSGIIATRDSQDRHGLVIEYPARSWQAFVVATKAGGFDAQRSLASQVA